MGKSKYVGLKASDIVEATKKATPTSYQSSMYWKPGLEKDQTTAEYVIRFLPNPDSTTGVNYVQRNSHMFNFPNGNYFNQPCPSAVIKKGPCPVCEVVRPLFKTGSQRDENIAKKQYAKPRFFSNIYVVSDPRDDHANEGKIFIFEFGAKIHSKCQQILEGDVDENEEGVVHFDLLGGANFKIIVNKVTDESGKSLPSYDESRFIRKGKALVLTDGKEIEEDDVDAFMEKAYNLNEKILADSCFKSYDELKTLFENRGSDSPFDEETPKTEKKVEKKASKDDDDDAPPVKKSVEEPKKKIVVEKEVAEKPKVDDDDDDLKKLLAEDE